MSIQTLASQEVAPKVPHARGPVILDVYQETCPPCRALEPRLVRVAQPHHAPMYLVDIHRDPPLADRFHIKSLPTILVLRDGRELQRLDGPSTDTQLRTAFEGSSGLHG